MDGTLDAIRRTISTTVPRWQSLVDTLPEELLSRPPAPGEWSAIECLRHLLLTERILFSVRLRRLIEGLDLVPFDPDAPREPEPARTPRELIEAFAALRRENEALIARLTPADLERSSYHPEYGSVTLGMQLNLWAAHDLAHTAQAERALMQAFIPETGPWRFEFAQEDVEARAR
jgi:uncharacterized damage-inducible protein DinB